MAKIKHSNSCTQAFEVNRTCGADAEPSHVNIVINGIIELPWHAIIKK